MTALDITNLPSTVSTIRDLIAPGSDKQAIINAHLKRINQARLHLLKPRHLQTQAETELITWYQQEMNIRTFASSLSIPYGLQAAPCIPFETIMQIIQDPSFDLIENTFLFAGWSPLSLADAINQQGDEAKAAFFTRAMVDRAWVYNLPDIPSIAINVDAYHQFWKKIGVAGLQECLHAERQFRILSLYDPVSELTLNETEEFFHGIDKPQPDPRRLTHRNHVLLQMIELQLFSLFGSSLAETVQLLAHGNDIQTKIGTIHEMIDIHRIVIHLFEDTMRAITHSSELTYLKLECTDWLFRPLLTSIITSSSLLRHSLAFEQNQEKLSVALYHQVGYKIDWPFPWLADQDSLATANAIMALIAAE
jgi:hypothetical protein